MRTFVAVEIPTHIRQRLTSVRHELAALLADQKVESQMRWNGESNYHLTLRFLGETTATQRQRIDKMLAESAAECLPFSLTLSGLGVFPNWHRMRVLWVGVGGEVQTLQHLQAVVEAGVQSCGFAQEPQRFHPHTTLARVSRDTGPGQIAQAGGLLAAQTKLAQSLGQWEVSDLVLMRSDLQKNGAVYTPLGVYRLGSTPH